MYGLLVPVGGGEPLPLLKKTVIVGRRPECDVVVGARSVSGQHCRLDLVDGVWRVTDLDSHNGTGVNGRRCRSAQIQPGQVLHVARQRFQLEYTPAAGGGDDDEMAMSWLQEADDAPKHGAGVDRSKRGASFPVPPSGRDVPADAVAAGPLGTLLPSGGGRPIVLSGPDLILGRSRRCDIRIASSTVSGRHCRLQLVSGYWVVEDLNSSNGVRVDGIRYQRKCVMPGAELSLSREAFILEYEPGDGVPPVVHDPWEADSGPLSRRRSLVEQAGLSARDVASLSDDDSSFSGRRVYSLNDD